MKKQVLVAWAAIIGLMSCASQNTFQTDPPFSISEAKAQNWAAGREEGGAGTKLSMRWNPYEPGAYTPDTLYFRGRALEPVVEDTETGMRLVASYEHLKWDNKDTDMVMSADSIQEVGNQPPCPWKAWIRSPSNSRETRPFWSIPGFRMDSGSIIR